MAEAGFEPRSQHLLTTTHTLSTAPWLPHSHLPPFQDLAPPALPAFPTIAFFKDPPTLQGSRPNTASLGHAWPRATLGWPQDTDVTPTVSRKGRCWARTQLLRSWPCGLCGHAGTPTSMPPPSTSCLHSSIRLDTPSLAAEITSARQDPPTNSGSQQPTARQGHTTFQHGTQYLPTIYSISDG